MNAVSDSNIAKIILLVIFSACLYAFHTETYLTWDASYQLFVMLETHDFHLIYNRKMMGLFQLPVLFYLKYFNDISIGTAKFLYGIIYSFVPFIVTFICYLFTKKRDSFFLLSICATLPFSMMQLHFLAEHMIACQVYCLLLLTLKGVLRGSKFTILASLTLAFFLTWLHPIAVYLLVFHAGLVLICRWKSLIKTNLSLIYAMSFIFMALVRFYYMLQDSYSKQVLSDNVIVDGILWGHSLVERIPIRDGGILLVAAFILIPLVLKFRIKRFIHHLVLSLTAVGFFVWYTSFIHAPNYMLNTRFLIFVIATPYYLLYFFDFIYEKSNKNYNYKGVALTSAVFYASFVALVSFDYQRDLKSLTAYLDQDSRTCITGIELTEHPGLRGWEHWASFFEYVMHKEIRSVDKAITGLVPCEQFEKHTQFTEWMDPYFVRKEGYFELNFSTL